MAVVIATRRVNPLFLISSSSSGLGISTSGMLGVLRSCRECATLRIGESMPSQDRLGNLLQFSQRYRLWCTGQEQHRGVRAGFCKGLELGTIGRRHIRHDLKGRGITTCFEREFVEHSAPLLDDLWGATGGHPAIAIRHRPLEHLPRRTPEKNGRV